jgi:hypothetical protein
MQSSPTASEILAAVESYLLDDLMPSLPRGARHEARVAANLCGIVRREWESGDRIARCQHDRLIALLRPAGEPDTGALNTELAERLLHGDEDFARQAVPVLLASLADVLAVNKPDHPAARRQA